MTEEDPDLLAGEALDILRGRKTKPMTDPTPTNPTTTIVAAALTNVLTDIWYEQNRHRDIDRYQEEFRKFCESVLYSALAAKENSNGK